MIIVGLDVSYTRTGIAVIHTTAEGDTTKYTLLDSWPMTFPIAERRLAKAYASISSEFAPGRHPGTDHIALAVIEDPIYGVIGRNSKVIPTTTVKLAQLQAIFKLFLEVRMVPYLTVSPTTVKRFITGRGDAEKTSVAAEIKRRFGISFEKDKGHDLSDACGLALWGALTKT